MLNLYYARPLTAMNKKRRTMDQMNDDSISVCDKKNDHRIEMEENRLKIRNNPSASCFN